MPSIQTEYKSTGERGLTLTPLGQPAPKLRIVNGCFQVRPNFLKSLSTLFELRFELAQIEEILFISVEKGLFSSILTDLPPNLTKGLLIKSMLRRK